MDTLGSVVNIVAIFPVGAADVSILIPFSLDENEFAH